MKHYVIAIDGAAGTGKTSVARRVADSLDIKYLSSGKIYRAIALAIVNNNIELTDEESISKLIKKIKVSIDFDGKNQLTFLNGEDVSSKLSGSVMDNASSVTCVYSCVRTYSNRIQKETMKKYSLVLEGRDIATVVAPKAKFKFYFTASTETKAKRRISEWKQDGKAVPSLKEVMAQIEKRDTRDSTRKIAPLKQSKDAVLIETDEKTIDEITGYIIKTINSRRKTKHSFYRFMGSCFYGFLKVALWLPSRILYPTKVIGKHNLPKKGEPTIFLPNHQSSADSILCLCYLKTRQYTIGKIEIKKNLFYRFLAGGAQWIFVDRNNPSRNFFKQTLSVLNENRALTIFPEGTRRSTGTTTDVEHLQIKSGASYFALKTGVKLVPVAILYKAKTFKKNYIMIGQPFFIEKNDKVRTEEIAGANQIIVDEMAKVYKQCEDLIERKKKKI